MFELAAMEKSVRSNSEVLLKQPRPLYVPDKKLALFWSGKAGCTFAIRWFLEQVDMLKAAEFYSVWVHRFRSEVFYKSEGFTKNAEGMLSRDVRRIKIVRNPYNRAVSSYLALCNNIHVGTNTPAHQKIASQIQKQVGRPVGKRQTLSFREYVRFLESEDLGNCDIHHRIQVHPAEAQGLVEGLHVIQLEDSGEQLPALEAKLGLKKTDLKTLSLSKHHSIRDDSDDFCGDRPFLDTRKVAVPSTECFYDTELREQVRRLYAVDFTTYGYDD